MKTPTPAEQRYMLEHAHETKVPGLIVSSTILLVIATLAVAFRFTARITEKIKLHASDWFILVALILFYVYSAAALCTIPYGLGRHSILVSDAKKLMAWMLVCETTLAASTLATKLSLCCLYVQIFPLLWVKRAAICISITVIAYTIAHTVSDVLQCIPLAALWDPSITDAKCFNFVDQATVMGVINILTDIAILVLPLKPIWGLMVSTARKWQLSLLLGLGGFVCIVSIVRIFYVRKMGTVDATWNDMEAGELFSVEAALGILAACLPACRKLLGRILKTPLGLRNLYSRPLSLNIVSNDDIHSISMMDHSSKASSSKNSQC